MQKTEFTYADSVYGNVYANRYMPDTVPKGIVQIVHGMAEHCGRYEDFAKALCIAGYGVYINDLPGHGKSSTKETLGHLPLEGFKSMLESVHTLTDIIKKENPDSHILLMGHSMGSFIAQAYICKYGSEISGCILSGTSGKNSMVSIGVTIARITKSFKGESYRSKLLDKLSFGSYNSKFKPNRTAFDWLSRDNEQVDKYIADSYCGFVCTTGFYHEFFTGLSKIHDEEAMKGIPKELPIYIFCGSEDPVGSETKTVVNLINTYRMLGIKSVEYKFYNGGRHEMLNETNKEEVIHDVIDWIKRRKEFLMTP